MSTVLRFASSFSLAALLSAGLLITPAEAGSPPADKVETWKRWQELGEQLSGKLREYSLDVEHERSYAGPFYSAERYEESAKRLNEELAGEQAEVLKAIKEIQAEFDGVGSPKEIEQKVWEKYGTVIKPGSPGFSRRLSDDRKKWLSTADSWPHLSYNRLLGINRTINDWHKVTVKLVTKHVDGIVEGHDKQWRGENDVPIRADLEGLTKLEELIAPTELALKYNADDNRRKEALTTSLEAVKAKITDYKAWLGKTIDETEMKPTSEKFSGDTDDLVEAMRRVLDDEENVLAVRVNTDWIVEKKDLIHRPIQYGVWAWVYRKVTPEHPAVKALGDEDLVQVDYMNFYTDKVAGVEAKPEALKKAYTNWSHLIRPGNVEGDGGGFFGTLLKVALYGGCCLIFLGAIGGGGYFAYTQVQSQQAAAAAAQAGDPAAGAAPHVGGAPQPGGVPPVAPPTTGQAPAPPQPGPPGFAGDPNQPPPQQG